MEKARAWHVTVGQVLPKGFLPQSKTLDRVKDGLTPVKRFSPFALPSRCKVVPSPRVGRISVVSSKAVHPLMYGDSKTHRKQWHK